jgi:hypothetical protein
VNPRTARALNRALHIFGLTIAAISASVATFALAEGAPSWAPKANAWILFVSAMLTNLRKIGGKPE